MNKILPVALLILLGSCIKEISNTFDKTKRISEISFSPEIAVPLVHSHLGLGDIINVDNISQIREEDDKSLTLIYNSSLFSLNAEDFIVLPDYSFNETLVLGPAELSALDLLGSVTVSINRDFDLDFSSNEIDSIQYKGGVFSINLSSTLQHNLEAELSIPSAVKNGNPIVHNLQANYAGTTPVNAFASTDLVNTTFDFTVGDQGQSQLSMSVELTLTKQGSNPMGATEEISLDIGLYNQAFRSFHGYIAPNNISNGEGMVNLSLFNDNKAGTFSLADPRAKLIFTNSFGVPIEASLLRFDGTNNHGNTVSLTGVPDPLPIPLLGPNEVGMKRKDSLILNNMTSNLADFINNLPFESIYEFNIETDPPGPATRNWFLDTSVVKCDVEVEIPLHGTAKDYVFESRPAFSLGIEESEGIEEVLFRLYTENGFPMDVNLQVYFVDSNSNTIIDSLINSEDQLVLPSGGVDGSGRVNQVYPKTTDIVYTGDRITGIKQANQIVLQARLNTLSMGGSQPDVKFFEDYSMFVKFGIQAKATLNQEL